MEAKTSNRRGGDCCQLQMGDTAHRCGDVRAKERLKPLETHFARHTAVGHAQQVSDVLQAGREF